MQGVNKIRICWGGRLISRAAVHYMKNRWSPDPRSQCEACEEANRLYTLGLCDISTTTTLCSQEADVSDKCWSEHRTQLRKTAKPGDNSEGNSQEEVEYFPQCTSYMCTTIPLRDIKTLFTIACKFSRYLMTQAKIL